MSKLVSPDSYAVGFYAARDDLFREHPYRFQVMLDGPADYSDPEVKARQVEGHLGI